MFKAGCGDLICFSHLRWNFVYQRPQHLMTRAARSGRVFFVEEPHYRTGPATLEVTKDAAGPWIIAPCLDPALDEECRNLVLAGLLDSFFECYRVRNFDAWYYTPMALKFSRHLRPRVCIYDCMDQLSAFRGAPADLAELETELLARTDVVFTGGPSLYEEKRRHHPHVHAFPSSIDRHHFQAARACLKTPADQCNIPAPHLGFIGVIDERLDLELLAGLAQARPAWHIVMIGPVAKIDPVALPQAANIHYLGQKSYDELPCYLAGWSVALMPFARNEATEFISPTKTPEYLAAGCQVVSTPIRDVILRYGEAGLVKVAADLGEFIAAIDAALATGPEAQKAHLRKVDQALSGNSWDQTWADMRQLIERAWFKHQPKQGVLPRPLPLSRIASYPAAQSQRLAHPGA